MSFSNSLMSATSPFSASYGATRYAGNPHAYAPTPAQLGSRERIHEAAQEFESVFLAQMLKPMFDTLGVDETFGGGEAEETWRGILVEKYADAMTKAGGIGLSEIVEREMLKLQEIKDDTGEEASDSEGSHASTPTANGPATGTDAGTGAESRSDAFAPRSPRSIGFADAGTTGGGASHEAAL